MWGYKTTGFEPSNRRLSRSECRVLNCEYEFCLFRVAITQSSTADAVRESRIVPYIEGRLKKRRIIFTIEASKQHCLWADQRISQDFKSPGIMICYRLRELVHNFTRDASPAGVIYHQIDKRFIRLNFFKRHFISGLTTTLEIRIINIVQALEALKLINQLILKFKFQEHCNCNNSIFFLFSKNRFPMKPLKL